MLEGAGPFFGRGVEPGHDADGVVAARGLDDPTVLLGKARKVGRKIELFGIGHVLMHEVELRGREDALSEVAPKQGEEGFGGTGPGAKSADDAGEVALLRFDERRAPGAGLFPELARDGAPPHAVDGAASIGKARLSRFGVGSDVEVAHVRKARGDPAPLE